MDRSRNAGVPEPGVSLEPAGPQGGPLAPGEQAERQVVEALGSVSLDVTQGTSLQIEGKTYQFSLGGNARGRYLKIKEIPRDKPASTVLLPEAGWTWFLRLLDYYIETCRRGLSPENKELQVERKAFRFSKGGNERGAFVRVVEMSFGHNHPRTSLVIPAANSIFGGWQAVSECIMTTCQLAPSSQQPGIDPINLAVVGPGPDVVLDQQSSTGFPMLKVGIKTFFFDIGQNDHGSFTRITEVVGEHRSFLYVPHEALSKFQEALAVSARLQAAKVAQGAAQQDARGRGTQAPPLDPSVGVYVQQDSPAGSRMRLHQGGG